MRMVTLGLRNLLRNKTRLALVVFLIGIPFFLLLVMQEIGSAVESQTAVLRRDVNTLLQIRPRGQMGHINMFRNDRLLPPEVLVEVRGTEHVVDVEPYLLAMAPMGYGFVIHVGLDPDDTRRLESHGEAGRTRILAGRDLAPGDRGKDVALIGQQYAEALGIRPEDVEAGTATITIDPKQSNSIIYPLDRPARELQVIGIYASGYVFGDQQLFMPIETLREIYGVEGALTWVYARVDDVENVPLVAANLHEKIGGVADVLAPVQVANFTAGTSRTVTRLATWGTGIALLLMVIVVFFVLLLQVRERAGEIGTLKAIGASNGGIAVQFLTEALALALLGGLVGLLFFWLLGEALTGGLFALIFEPFLSPTYASLFDSLAVGTGISEAVLGSAVIAAVGAALLGSAYGIWQVIRLSPLEAMRYE